MPNHTNPSDSINDEVDAQLDEILFKFEMFIQTKLSEEWLTSEEAKQKLLNLLNEARIEELEDLKRYDWTHEPNEHPDDVVCGHIDKRIAELRKDKPNE